MKYKFSYEIELTPLEADIRLEDLHPVSPWREVYETFGLGVVVYWARKRDGKEIKTPNIDYITKGARLRSRQKEKSSASI